MKIGFLIFYFVCRTLNYVYCDYDQGYIDTRSAQILSEILQNTQKYEQTQNIHDLSEYDFIVAGAGSAGCTVVARLLQKKPNLKILLIEAGFSNQSKTLIDYRFSLSGTATDPEYYYYDTTEPISMLNNQKITFTSGRALGGSSVVNYMTWVRGNNADFDHWSKLTKDKSWKYSNVLPIFKSLEKYSKAKRNDRYRGNNGPIFVSTRFTDNRFSRKIVKRVQSSGYALNKDYNAKSQFGVSVIQLNVKPIGNNGIRQDAFSTQFKDFIKYPNLHIITQSYADKVVLDENNKVKYLVFKNDDISFFVKAKYEVVLSCGALKSPLVLMRSGIGNCNDLKKLNIPCNVPLKGVGRGLSNHPYIIFVSSLPLASKLNKSTDNIIYHTIYDRKRVGSNFIKPKFLLSYYYVRDNPVTNANVILSFMFQLHPKSKGQIKLRSTDVRDSPIIIPNTFKNKDDLIEFRQGVRKALKISKILEPDLLGTIIQPSSTNLSPNQLDDFIKANANPGGHFSSTCKMGKSSDKYAVLDSKLKVKGVVGLRVADNSIMPVITSGNTNAPAMLIGAKCAEMILKQYFNI